MNNERFKVLTDRYLKQIGDHCGIAKGQAIFLIEEEAHKVHGGEPEFPNGLGHAPWLDACYAVLKENALPLHDVEHPSFNWRNW